VNALIDPRDLIFGIITRLRVIAPIGLVLWMLGVQVGPIVRLLLVPAIVVMLAVDTIAHAAPASAAPTAATFRVRRTGSA